MDETEDTNAAIWKSDETEDTNAAIWKSDEIVEHWVAGVDEREAKRTPQWRLMGELLPFDAHDAFTVLDLGAGTGAAARAILELYPRSNAVLADFSPQMMAEGARAMARYNGRFRYVAFDMVKDVWSEKLPAAVEAVVSSQCIHHLPDERKQSIFVEVHGHLVPGGWYLNFDPVTTDDTLVDAAWRRAGERQDPRTAHKSENRTPEEQARYENHVRHLAPLERQLDFLRSAGFGAVDVYWKHLDSVIYGGCRLPGPG